MQQTAHLNNDHDHDQEIYTQYLLYKSLREIIQAWELDAKICECDIAAYSCLYLQKFREILNNPTLECETLSHYIREVLNKDKCVAANAIQGQREDLEQRFFLNKAVFEISQKLANKSV